MAVMPRGGCPPPRSVFAAVAFAVLLAMLFAVMAFAAACLVGAVLGAVAVAARGLLVKNLLLFGAELAVELFDGLVAGGHAVLAFGLHGLHAVEALGCGQALERVAVSAGLRRAGGCMALTNWFHAPSCALVICKRCLRSAMRLAWRSARRSARRSASRGFARCSLAWAEASPDAGMGVWAVAAAAAAAIRATASQDLLRWSMVRFLSSEGFMKKMKCRRLRSHEKARRGPGWFRLVLLLL